MNHSRDFILVFVTGVIIFAVGLPDEFVGFQCRFGLFAKEMLWNGPTYFPTVYGQPYPDYPGTSTWLAYLGARIAGGVTPFVTTLPTILASAMVLAFTYSIGALRSRKWGLYAVFVMLFTYEFAADSRITALDQFTSLATVVCFWLVYSSFVLGKTRRLWLVPVMLAFGFAFRGPIGLAVPAAVTCSFYLWPLNIRRLITFAVVAVVTGGLCMAACLAAARAQGGQELVSRILASQAGERLTDHAIPWYFYIVNGFTSYAMAYPLAIIVVVAAIWPNRHRIDPDHRLLCCLAVWAVVILGGMSIPAAKKARYLLPAIPAFSLMAAWVFACDEPDPFMRKVRDSLMGFFLWLPIGLFLATLALLSLGYRFGLQAQMSLLIPAAALLLCAAAGLFANFRAIRHRQAIGMAVATTAFLLFLCGVAEPLAVAKGRSAVFASDVESIRKEKQGPLVFFRLGPDGEDIKYASNLDYPIHPSFISSVEAIGQLAPTAYIVASDKNYAALPKDLTDRCDVVARGNMGHKSCVAFRIPRQ